MVINGYVRVCMGIYKYTWIYIGMYWYRWIGMGMNGSILIGMGIYGHLGEFISLVYTAMYQFLNTYG